MTQSIKLVCCVPVYFSALCIAPMTGCDIDDHPCKTENHCMREDGDLTCEEGYNWEDPSDSENYNCVEIEEIPQPPEPVLGFGGSVPDDATLVTIIDVSLSNPGDLEFNPEAPNELWITSQDDDGLIVVTDPGDEDWEGYKTTSWNQHFLHEAIGISFGDSQTFATCQESRNEEDPLGYDFMGPTLWPSDIEAFRIEITGADNVHLDMLHDTPLCVGVAADTRNAFYVFNGLEGVIDWYDFKEPHEPGGTDHSDGTKRRYVDLDLERIPGVHSGLALDHDTGWLYIADSGNGRIAVLETDTGTGNGYLFGDPMELPMQKIEGATFWDLIPRNADYFEVPSGLLLHGGLIYVSDYATGYLHAFSMDGAPVNQLDTGLGPNTLGGITVGPDERLYLVDRQGDRVFRLDPHGPETEEGSEDDSE
jgi:hypothetical protein